MQYLKQFGLILLFSFLGELLHALIPLPVPGSIYGLLLLFLALCLGIVRLQQLQETAKFLLQVRPVLFVPAGVGLLESWGELKPLLLPAILLISVSTVLVMGISGRVTQRLLRRKKKTEGEAKK